MKNSNKNLPPVEILQEELRKEINSKNLKLIDTLRFKREKDDLKKLKEAKLSNKKNSGRKQLIDNLAKQKTPRWGSLSIKVA